MSDINDAMMKMLKEAADKGVDGFSRQDLGATRDGDLEILETWAKLVKAGYIAAIGNAVLTKGKDLYVTQKGKELLELNA